MLLNEGRYGDVRLLQPISVAQMRRNQIPGIGTDFVNAVLNRDQFLILGLVLVYSTILILFNLLVDITYAWVDPRIDLADAKTA